MKSIEIEIQVNVEKIKPLLKFLEKNAEFKSEKRQIDEYFTPPHRDFLAVRPAAEWLRLRNADSKYSITYKNWHYDKDGKSHYCDEYETELKNLEPIKKIFKTLNFKTLTTVDKVRRTWNYKDYEISYDSVKNLGDFVEIEYIGNDKNPDPAKITDQMIKFLKTTGCGKIKRNYNGYPFLLLFPNQAKYEIL